MGGTNQKEAYAVDLNEILPSLEDIILHEKLSSKLKISRHEYLERVKYGATHLKKQMGYKDEAYFVIDYAQPAFDYWFGYYLTISKSYKIPLILNDYFKNSGFSSGFLKTLEHSVLDCIEYNVFHDVSDHLEKIVSWLDETKSRYGFNSNASSQTINIVNVHITQNNYHQEIHNNWGGQNLKDISKNESNGVVQNEKVEVEQIETFIKHPINNKLFDAIKLNCEKSSYVNLRSLFDNGNANEVIVFDKGLSLPNFCHCMAHIRALGIIPLNQTELIQWLNKHIGIRQLNKEVINISASYSEKLLRTHDKDYDVSQFDFRDWKRPK